MYLLGAQFLRNFGPLLVLFFLARLTDQATVGRYSLILAIVTPFFVFGQLGLRTVSLTLKPNARFPSYVSVQSAALLLALICAIVFGAIGTPELLLAIFLAGLLKTADAFSDFLSGPLQRADRAKTIFIASLIAAVLVTSITAITLYVTRDLTATLFSLAITSLACAYLLLFRPAQTATRSGDARSEDRRPEFNRVLLAGLPLGTSMAMMSLISTVPQYIVTASHGEAETARFAVLLYTYALADIVTGTVSQAWVPSAQAQLDSGPSSVVRIALQSSSKWTLLYLPATVLGLLAAAFVFPYVFGTDYTLSFAEAIPLGLAILTLPFAHFMAISVSIQNFYSHTLTLALSSALISVLACFLLIPFMGIAGAFWALFASVVIRGAVGLSILMWDLRTRGSRHSE